MNPLASSQAERIGVVQPGEEEGSLTVPKEAPAEVEGDFGQGHGLTGQGGIPPH